MLRVMEYFTCCLRLQYGKYRRTRQRKMILIAIRQSRCNLSVNWFLIKVDVLDQLFGSEEALRIYCSSSVRYARGCGFERVFDIGIGTLLINSKMP
jgi:hypothetical protein